MISGKTYRLVGPLLLLTALAAGTWSWLGVRGVRIAREHLVYSLSTGVPAWAEWHYTGARPAADVLPPLASRLLCLCWCAALTAAGFTTDKRARPILLLAAVAGAIACIGAGDLPMALTAGTVALLAAGASRRFAPGQQRAFKTAATGAVGAALAVVGIAVAWDATFPGQPRVPVGALLAGSAACALAYIVWRRRPIAGTGPSLAVMAALVAGIAYPGPNPRGWCAAWSETGRDAWRRLGQRLAPALTSALDAYRPTPAEAAASRLPRAEIATDRARLPELLQRATSRPALRAWLLTDDALYTPRTDTARRDALSAATEAAHAVPGKTGAALRGWLALDSGNHAEALREFGRTGSDSFSRLGAGLAAAGAGDRARAVDELTLRCVSDPRAIFSPAWDREPLASLRNDVRHRWKTAALAANDARQDRFVIWSDAWERAGGNVRRFLEDPANTAPVPASVRLYRERLLDTLKAPDDAKIGAIFSAGVAMFTDRHVNLGQCHRLFEACDGGARAAAIPERILISRPLLPGWGRLPVEGGAGTAPHDFEENLLVRMTTYGLDGDDAVR